MSAKSKTSTTATVGYFNSNDFPMQLVVSEYNLTINLKPKEWIFDRSSPARLVTDPVLDRYVGKNKLSRATNPQKESPIVLLTAVNAQPQPGQPVPAYTHSVTSATGFVKDDASGQLRPVLAVPSTPVPGVTPPVSYNPVKGFTIAEARRLKLIKPTKQVKEDAGAPESDHGAPTPLSQLPDIEIATDTSRPQVASEVVAQPITPDQHGVMEAMTTGVAAISPDEPDLVAATIAAVKKGPAVPPPIPSNPTPTEIVVGPDPASMIVESEIAPAAPAVVAPAKAATKSAKPAAGSFQCPKCRAKPFPAPRYFTRHVNHYHPDEAAALVAQVLGR